MNPADPDASYSSRDSSPSALFAPELRQPGRMTNASGSSSPTANSVVAAHLTNSSPLRALTPGDRHAADTHHCSKLHQHGSITPSEGYAALSLEPAPRHAMSDEDGSAQPANHGHAGRTQTVVEPNSSRRSASPAKRTAADMEDIIADSGPVVAQRIPERPHADVDMQDHAISSPSYTSESREESHQVNVCLNDQIRQVKQAVESSPIRDGDSGYLVAAAWMDKILARASDTAEEQKYSEDLLAGELGPVDNNSIVAIGAFKSGSLVFSNTDTVFVPIKAEKVNRLDFQIVPQPAWDLLMTWYGLAEGQVPIVRFAHNTAATDAHETNIEYELRPLIITIQQTRSKRGTPSHPPTPAPDANSQSQHAPRLVASRQDKFQDFLAAAKRAAGIDIENKVRIWRRLDPVTATQSAVASVATDAFTSAVLADEDFMKMAEGVDYEMIDVKDYTNTPGYNGKSQMGLLGIDDDQVIVLEPQSRPEAGEYVSDVKRKKKAMANPTDSAADSGSSSPSGPVTRARSQRSGRSRGSIGLTNLGNTCYMNSALQCISRIEELAVYFIDSKKWHDEINHDNPLGHNGRMARAFGDLLAGLYQPRASGAFRPSSFKNALSYAQPMFSGYGQQDSQEFLSFLVDALHEDLNRIHNKPYTTNPDSEDDKVHDPGYIRTLGEKYRANHHARNDSIAMDLFNGFYKNTMVCPICNKISVTFDPYSLLTLQLPIDNTWQHDLYFIPKTGPPSLHKLDMDKHASLKSLKRLFATKVQGVDVSRLIVLEGFNHKIWKIWKDDEVVSDIGPSDIIYIYELAETPSNPFHPQRLDVSSEIDLSRGDLMAVPVHHRIESERRLGGDPIGHPTMILLTRAEAMDLDAIASKVIAATAQITSKNFEAATPPLNDAVMTEEAGISDSSVPSEDGYVDISTSTAKPMYGSTSASIHKHVSALLRVDEALTSAQRSMFKLKYFETGKATGKFLGQDERSLDMESRVEQASRAHDRPSASANSDRIEDSDNDAASVTSHTSSVVSDPESPPDIVLGDRRDLDTFDGDVQSDEDLPILSLPRQRKQKGYGNKGRRARETAPPTVLPQPAQRFNTVPDLDGNDYYIRLDEGILVEWSSEAWDMLFGGSINDTDRTKGYNLLDPGALPIVIDDDLEEKIARRTRRRKAGVTLDECFAETAKTETLSEDNAWYCNQCRELRLADKTLEIWTLPDILVVHLKRFSGDRGYRRDKIDVNVEFPIEGLDLTSRVGNNPDDKSCVYDLFAVDNHFGGLGGGHYTATAKNFFDDKWYDYNDSSVSQTAPERAVTPAAYLLFYRRRSSTPLGPPYLSDLVARMRNGNNDDDNDDDEDAGSGPGEDSLGDCAPGSRASSRLPGSSSHGTNAGSTVGPAAQALAGQGATRVADHRLSVPDAGSDLTTMATTATARSSRTLVADDDDEGIAMELDSPRPVQPSLDVYQSRDGGWGFDGLDDAEHNGVPYGADTLSRGFLEDGDDDDGSVTSMQGDGRSSIDENDSFVRTTSI